MFHSIRLHAQLFAYEVNDPENKYRLIRRMAGPENFVTFDETPPMDGDDVDKIDILKPVAS